MRKNLIKKNVKGSEYTLFLKAECPRNHFSNTFIHTCNQAEQIKKGVIRVQIVLEIHLT